MVIASEKLEFLDLTNFQAPGTSLANLYKSYGVPTVKGTFPYQWFSDLSNLGIPSLLPREDFFSTLKGCTISEEAYQEVWEGMDSSDPQKTFRDYARLYNNLDVVGLVQVVAKLLTIERETKLDPFKDAVSLPGLTQRYLFQNLDQDDYFVGIGPQHKHLYKMLRASFYTRSQSYIPSISRGG